MVLSGDDRNFIQDMFRDDCTASTVRKVFPHAPKTTIQWLKVNFDCFGAVRKPASALERRGPRCKIDGPIHEWLIELLSLRNGLWLEELVFELWCQFEVEVHKTTISRLLESDALSPKINTRIAQKRDPIQQGVYEEKLAELMAEGATSGAVEDPVDMLLYLDESAASEKVLFRPRSWSQIGHSAFTKSELVNNTRCSVLSALDIDGYLSGSTLVVEGAVTQEIFEHWLETAILPRCEPLPEKRSIVIMDKCSTHHSERVGIARQHLVCPNSYHL